MRARILTLTALAMLVLAAGTVRPAAAETYQLSWDPVTSYSDGTAFEAGRTVSYTAYWTTDATLSAGSLRAIASGIAGTSTTFDPGAVGMARGQVVYFTAKSVLNTGEESSLSPGYTWNVPKKSPGAPNNMKIIKIN